MLQVSGNLAIEMLVRREGWAWGGVLNLGALEAVGVVKNLEHGVSLLLLFVHGMAF